MTTRTEPTAAAMRAAWHLYNNDYLPAINSEAGVTSVAAIIDAETGLKKLVAALRNAYPHLQKSANYEEMCAAQAGHHSDCRCKVCQSWRQEIASLQRTICDVLARMEGQKP